MNLTRWISHKSIKKIGSGANNIQGKAKHRHGWNSMNWNCSWTQKKTSSIYEKSWNVALWLYTRPHMTKRTKQHERWFDDWMTSNGPRFEWKSYISVVNEKVTHALTYTLHRQTTILVYFVFQGSIQLKIWQYKKNQQKQQKETFSIFRIVCMPEANTYPSYHNILRAQRIRTCTQTSKSAK